VDKFPYGLLTETDYGILTENDFDWGTDPHPFEGEWSSYSYWQCLPSVEVKVWCRELPNDPSDKEQHGEPMIEIIRGKDIHRFGQRRAFELSWCRETVKTWKQVLASESSVCVAGIRAGAFEWENENRHVDWVYEVMKTKKACHDYFEYRCPKSKVTR
jgi:hypothetical protein